MPFNLALHEHLAASGYFRMESYWEETGDPENGPMGLSGWPTTDQYEDETHTYYYTEEGRFSAEERDLALEAHLKEMEEANP